MKFPFTVDPDPEWQPKCDAIQKEVLAGGPIPKYLRYQWKPEVCDLETFNPEALCAQMDGQTIGVVGDSTSQQFYKTLVGLMLGHWSRTSDTYEETVTELCPNSKHRVRLLWHRRDDWPQKDSDFDELKHLFNESDVVVLNWGPHYRPDTVVSTSIGKHAIHKEDTEIELEEMISKSVNNLKELIQDHWSPKPSKHIFWRASMGYHNNCDKAEEPYTSDDAARTHGDRYHVRSIYDQEHRIVWPRMRKIGATILRTDAFTKLRADGHRVNGHNGALDCLHYCEPGPQLTWLQLFYHYMMGHVTHEVLP